MKIILAILIAVVATGSIKGQYVTDVYTATTNEVNDGLNQTKPVTPWGLKNWIGGGGGSGASVTINNGNSLIFPYSVGNYTIGLSDNTINAALEFRNSDDGGVLSMSTDGVLSGKFHGEINASSGNVITNGQTGVRLELVTEAGNTPIVKDPFGNDVFSYNPDLDLFTFRPQSSATFGTIYGNAFGATNIQPSNIVGVLSDSQLSTNIARLNQNAVWTSNGVATATIGTNGNFNLSGSGVVGGISVTSGTVSSSGGFTIGNCQNSFWYLAGSGGVGGINAGYWMGVYGEIFKTGLFRSALGEVTLYTNLITAGKVSAGTTVTATNGYVFHPKTSATTYAQLGTSNTVVLYGNNAIPQTIYARSFNAQSNAVDVPFVSLAPRWIDAPGQIIPLAVGSGALTIADMGDGIYGYQFDRIFGANAYGTQKLCFNSEAPHNLYQTNVYFPISSTNLYVEGHHHGRPGSPPVAPNTNISFQLVWKACTPGLPPSATFTNVVTYGLTAGSTNEILVEFNHTTYASNQPSITTVWPASITVVNPGSNSYMEQAGASFIIRQPSFHVPISSFHGSTTDATQ